MFLQRQTYAIINSFENDSGQEALDMIFAVMKYIREHTMIKLADYNDEMNLFCDKS